jgi:hypothetical protein
MNVERARFLGILDGLGIHEGDVDGLREASHRVDDLRFADKGPGTVHGTGNSS